jgi:rhodanese-related sulfurtransferase
MIVERISPEEAHRRKQCGECDLHLDVRTPEEYQEVHAPDSLLVPYMLKQGDKMVPNPNFLSEVEKLTGGNLERKLIVNCASGRRSAMAAEELSKKGYKVIADMEGGIQQYLQKPHLPVNRPKSQWYSVTVGAGRQSRGTVYAELGNVYAESWKLGVRSLDFNHSTWLAEKYTYLVRKERESA